METRVDDQITASVPITATLFILLNKNVAYKEQCSKNLLLNWNSSYYYYCTLFFIRYFFIK